MSYLSTIGIPKQRTVIVQQQPGYGQHVFVQPTAYGQHVFVQQPTPQQVVYVQQPAPQQVVYVQQPAPQRVVYVQQPAPQQVVYGQQSSNTILISRPNGVSTYTRNIHGHGHEWDGHKRGFY
jgi:hypothetical protein